MRYSVKAFVVVVWAFLFVTPRLLADTSSGSWPAHAGSGGGGSAFVPPTAKVASTATLTLSGAQTIDGVAVVAGDRVLEAIPGGNSANGTYVVASGSWSRAPEYSTSSLVTTGSTVSVYAGQTYAGSLWQMSTAGAITVGTTALTFSQIGNGTGGYESQVVQAAQLWGISPSCVAWSYEEWAPVTGEVDRANNYGFSGNVSNNNFDNQVTTVGGGIQNIWTDGSTPESFIKENGMFSPALTSNSGRVFLSMRTAYTAGGTAPMMFTGLISGDSSRTIGVGVVTGTTNISFQYNNGKFNAGSFLTLIPRDANYHVYVIDTLGDGKIHVSTDGAEASGSPVTPSTYISGTSVDQPFIIFDAQTPGTDHNTILSDWYFIATPAPGC